MKSIKQIVRDNLQRLIAYMVVIILLVAMLCQVFAIQYHNRRNAESTFTQIEQILHENSRELALVEAEYRQTCLLNGEVIAYIIQQHPEILGNVEEFRQLAYKMEVDEIHIFDDTGRIFTGTHPEYFNFTFETGEQIGFFAPMLTDKSLRLCQDIMPNTAEGKLVQYSALWSPDGKYIIQVGMYPEAVLEATEKNELSYIFSLLQGAPGVSLYAIDLDSGEIIGSTSGHDNGRQLTDLGFPTVAVARSSHGRHITISGVASHCLFEEVGQTLLAYVISNDQLYVAIPGFTVMLAGFLLLVAVVLSYFVQRINDSYVVDGIAGINEKLRAISAGNLDERVEVESCFEFSELSEHINQMVRDLLASTDKMSLVLDRTNMHIGVYEYSTRMQSVRFTEHIPEIFGRRPVDRTQLCALIDELRDDPVMGAENTYRSLRGKHEQFLRLEEVPVEGTVLGIVMDVTDEVIRLRRTQAERDIDLLTGLENRRSMESHFEQLFADCDALGAGALVVIDADNLKDINDTYGHSVGDGYLRGLAEALRAFGAPHQLTARQGGDEFVLLLYGYTDNDAVLADIDRLRDMQDNATVALDDGILLPMRFSFGYELIRGRRDYDIMLSTADGHMYASKRERKKRLR